MSKWAATVRAVVRRYADYRSAVDPARLLNALCVELGYCLPSKEQQKIIADPPTSVEEFMDAVLVAEGLDPVLMATEQRQQIRSLVAAAFGEPARPSGRTEMYRPRRRRP